MFSAATKPHELPGSVVLLCDPCPPRDVGLTLDFPCEPSTQDHESQPVLDVDWAAFMGRRHHRVASCGPDGRLRVHLLTKQTWGQEEGGRCWTAESHDLQDREQVGLDPEKPANGPEGGRDGGGRGVGGGEGQRSSAVYDRADPCALVCVAQLPLSCWALSPLGSTRGGSSGQSPGRSSRFDQSNIARSVAVVVSTRPFVPYLQ